MKKHLFSLMVVGGMAALLVAISGCAQTTKAAIATGERTFYVTGLEYKGSTSTQTLAAPPMDPKNLGDGYRYKKPGDADKNDLTKWEVSTYRWEPGIMTVLQGDKVNLVGFIVNGDKHDTWIEDPNGGTVMEEKKWERGREYKVSFVADKVGYYILHCDEHDPTMTAYILVLPR